MSKKFKRIIVESQNNFMDRIPIENINGNCSRLSASLFLNRNSDAIYGHYVAVDWCSHSHYLQSTSRLRRYRNIKVQHKIGSIDKMLANIGEEISK